MVGGGVGGKGTQAARRSVRDRVKREIGCGLVGFSWGFLVSGERCCRRLTAADLADDGDFHLFVRFHMERRLKSDSCSDGGRQPVAAQSRPHSSGCT